jgi:hypothetical protein
MTRRLDALHFDASRLDTSGQDTSKVKASQGQTINRRKLDGVDFQAGRSRRSEKAWHSREAEAAAPDPSPLGTQSPDDVLVDFVMPRITTPAVLRRSVSILQYCVSDLVPNLEGGAQLRSLAENLMEEEIERHRDLLERLQKGNEI